MNQHDYTAQEALATLIRKLGERDVALAAHVQSVINAGQDVEEKEPFGQGNRRPRTYRRTVPYSPEDALQAALAVLQAYFIELPRIVNSTLDMFAGAATGVPVGRQAFIRPDDEKEQLSLEGRNAEKEVQIELQTETQITSQADQPTLTIGKVDTELIEAEQANFNRLLALTTF